MANPSSFSFLRSIAVLTFALFALTACEDCLPCFMSSDNNDAVSVDSSTMPAQSFIMMAPKAPPAPIAEEKPDLGSLRTQTWRPGHWEYSGGDFNWVSGEVIDKPSPTAVWSPDHWVQHTYGWGFVPGYWQ